MLSLFLRARPNIVSTALPKIRERFNAPMSSPGSSPRTYRERRSTPLYGNSPTFRVGSSCSMSAIGVFFLAPRSRAPAQTIAQLIIFRADKVRRRRLMTLVFAADRDVVSPSRKRKISGLFRRGFGVASVVGPLLGGFFTDQISWPGSFI